jgi:hypothetical protein
MSNMYCGNDCNEKPADIGFAMARTCSEKRVRRQKIQRTTPPSLYWHLIFVSAHQYSDIHDLFVRCFE